MSEIQDTKEPLDLGEGIEAPTKRQPRNQSGQSGKSKTKEPIQDQKQAIVQRINKAKTDTQTAQIQQARDYADAVTDSVASLAVPLIGLNIIEKGVNSLASGGNVAKSFLHSMPTTGITINANSISMIDMDNQLELEAMDDPLISALLLIEA
jgi:hypothetical protein